MCVFAALVCHWSHWSHWWPVLCVCSGAVQAALPCVRLILHGLVTMSNKEMVSPETGQSHPPAHRQLLRLCVHQINEFFVNGFLISCQASRAAVFGAVCLTVGVAGCVFHCESEDQYVTSSCSWSVLALSVFSCICLWLFVQLDRLLNFADLLLLFMLFLCYCVCFRFDISCYLSLIFFYKTIK